VDLPVRLREQTRVTSPHFRSGHTGLVWLPSPDAGMQRRSGSKIVSGLACRKADGCWSWTGFINDDGYGLLSRPGRRSSKVGGASTVVGDPHGPVPAGMNVCHRMRQPAMRKPWHLFLGTQQDNMQDCARKKRVFLREQTWTAETQSHDCPPIRQGRSVSSTRRGPSRKNWHTTTTCR